MRKYGRTEDQGEEMLSFNMAMDYTQKIAQYLHEFETWWSAGRLEKALWSLKKVWHKLSPFLNDDEDDIIDKKFNSVQKMIVLKENRAHINKKLEDLNRHIGKKLKSRGLLIPVSDDPRYLFR